MTPWIVPLIGWPVLALVMLSLWVRQRRTGNAGTVDVAWTFGLGALGAAIAAGGAGFLPRRILLGTLIGFWALRLGLHLARRVAGEPEDGRYRALRRKAGASADRWFFWFFQAQALLAVLLTVPLAYLSDQAAFWRIWDGVGATLWLLSLIGEAVADCQLAEWRSDPKNRGRTCRSGLWRYSRHPNYFFEWLHWLAYPVMAIGLPFGFLLWLAPLVMGLLIRYVTGIPPTEEQSLRSRGEDYRQYQATTNAFFPGPPRAAAGSPLRTQ
ncbi:MAG: DUF1295 domain-containing protein [Planctomycetota bacterium]